MICKTAEPIGKHCPLPAPLDTPVGECVKCPDCGTWYQNKRYGTFGTIWTVLLLNKSPKGQS